MADWKPDTYYLVRYVGELTVARAYQLSGVSSFEGAHVPAYVVVESIATRRPVAAAEADETFEQVCELDLAQLAHAFETAPPPPAVMR